MVLMNLGVVALPIMELGRFVLDPMRILLQRCGVLRGDVSTALVSEPALSPADAKLEINEVLRFAHMVGYGTRLSSCLAAKQCPCHTLDLES